MKLVSLKLDGAEQAAIVAPHGMVLINTINYVVGRNWSVELFEMIGSGQLEEVREWYQSAASGAILQFDVIPPAAARFGPLYRYPRKIWGVGFNYVKDAAEWAAIDRSVEPVGFMKPDTSLIGPHDEIRIPAQSSRTIAEAELGIVIGKRCRNVCEDEAMQYVAGFTPVLDIGADDIHQQNPRYLTRSKSFDTFFSCGPELLTPDEVSDLAELGVSTVHNGVEVQRNQVCNMRFQPAFIVAYHSQVMTLLPGDILMTGTPGAAVIRDGDVVECRIDGFMPLINYVVNDVNEPNGHDAAACAAVSHAAK
ncbi:FAA hydrolase family protein [Paenibacillaceae bacterium]|nr:FAA hydrolase family protein [Paenibacillaceae bacterium]